MTARRLATPVLLSGLLLLGGDAAILARTEAVQRQELWQSYRRLVAAVARDKARELAAGTKVSAFLPSGPARPTLHSILVNCLAPGLTLLAVGLLALVLVAAGRRLVWLPVAAAALTVSGDSLLTANSPVASDVTLAGVTAALAVMAVATLPLLLATRSVRVKQPVPQLDLVVGLVLVSAAVLDGIRTLGPWELVGDPELPEILPTLAVIAVSALLMASRLRRRWLPLLMVLPVVGVPAFGQAFYWHSFGGGDWGDVHLAASIWGVLGLMVAGAAAPTVGALVVRGCRATTCRARAAKGAVSAG